MRYRDIILQENTVVASGLDLTSIDTFKSSLPRVSAEVRSALAAKAKELTADKVPAHFIKLYHGSPNAKEIKNGGFKLTKGQRSGFMGSTYEVNNQGIFLTDSKTLAHFFGSNRADLEGYEIVTCYVDPSRLLTDLKKLPKDTLTLGLALCNKWSGASLKRRGFTQDEWWWLLDKPEFVASLKMNGFTGAVYRETAAVRKAASAHDAHTFIVFDPASIVISGHRQMSLDDFYKWLVNGGIQTIDS